MRHRVIWGSGHRVIEKFGQEGPRDGGEDGIRLKREPFAPGREGPDFWQPVRLAFQRSELLLHHSQSSLRGLES